MKSAAKKNNPRMDDTAPAETEAARLNLKVVETAPPSLQLRELAPDKSLLLAAMFPRAVLLAQHGPFAWWSDRDTQGAPTFLCRLDDLMVVRLDELRFELDEQIRAHASPGHSFMKAARLMDQRDGEQTAQLTVEEAFAQGDEFVGAFADDLQAEFSIVDLRPGSPHRRVGLMAHGPSTRVRRHHDHLIFAVAPPAGHSQFGRAWPRLTLQAPAAKEQP